MKDMHYHPDLDRDVYKDGLLAGSVFEMPNKILYLFTGKKNNRIPLTQLEELMAHLPSNDVYDRGHLIDKAIKMAERLGYEVELRACIEDGVDCPTYIIRRQRSD